MNRIEFNVQTGERRVVDLTAEEVADAQARAVAHAAARAARPPSALEAMEALLTTEAVKPGAPQAVKDWAASRANRPV